MLIVGDSLRQLNEEFAIVNSKDCYDVNCLTLHLDKNIFIIKKVDNISNLIYGEEIPGECVSKEVIKDEGIIIPSHTSILACSTEEVSIPLGYYGFLQTKGTLARYCVSVHFCDGQVDTGFEGKVTFEMFNGSCYDIKIHKNQPVASLYIVKTSSRDIELYKGKYNKADKPTLPKEI